MHASSLRVPHRVAALAIACTLAIACLLASAAPAHATTSYDLWVSGVRVTSDNQSDVLGDGTVSFEEGSAGVYILTLKDAELVYANDPLFTSDMAAIYTLQDLAIKLEGDNEILPFPKDEPNEAYIQGILARDASIGIYGPGSLSITVIAPDDSNPSTIYGIWGNRDLAVEGARLDVYGSALNKSNIEGISIVGSASFGDSNVSIEVHGGKETCSGVYGKNIYVTGDSRLDISGGSNSSSELAWVQNDMVVEGASHVRLMGSESGLIVKNCLVEDNASLLVNCMSGVGITCTSGGRIGVTDHASLIVTSFYGTALSAVPDTTGHYNPTAFVGDEYGEPTFKSNIGSDITTYSRVQIPGASIVCRIAGDYANETSAMISRTLYGNMMYLSSVVLARDDDFADALGATGLAGALHCPIILTDRTALSPAAAAEINQVGVWEVYIVGGPGAMKSQLEADLVEQCDIDPEDIHRVWGENSYDTSLACAEAIEDITETPADTAIIAMSTNFQDALSMSPIAYAYEMPVILQTWSTTSSDRGLTLEAQAYLEGKDLLVAGGPGAISDASLSGLNIKKRIYGDTGYDTSNAIAEWAVDEGLLNAGGVVFACGAQAPKGTDALAGSALAGEARCPILLVNGNNKMESVNTMTIDKFVKSHSAEIREAYVLGGNYVMPPELYAKIQEAMGGAHDFSMMP